MIHTPAARASTLWHGLGTAAKSVILTATAAALVGAGYAAGTMQTQPLQLSITVYDSTSRQPLDIDMCSAVTMLQTPMTEFPADVREQFERAVEARCPRPLKRGKPPFAAGATSYPSALNE